MIILAIVFGLLINGKPKENQFAANFINADSKTSGSFKRVPVSVQKNVNDNKSMCYNWNISTMPKVTLTNKDANKGFRVAILARNSTLRTSNSGGAVSGAKDARVVFYPGQNNSNDEFIFFKGTESQVNTYLTNLQVCPNKLGESERVYVHAEEVNLLDVNGSGLKYGEATSSYVVPTASGASSPADIIPNFSAWTSTTNITGNYLARLKFNDNLAKAQLVGNLRVKNASNQEMDYLGSNVAVTCARNNNDIPITLTNGVFTGEVRIFPGANYVIKCKFVDQSNISNPATYTNYQYNEITVVVPGDTQGNEVSAGQFMLTTKNGTYCNQNDINCWNNMTNTYGTVNVTTSNGLNGKMVSGVDVVMTKYWWPQDSTYVKGTTNNGKVELNNIFYNCYTLTINDVAYKRNSRRVCLQSATKEVAMVLIPTNNSADYIISLSVPKKIDFDYNLTLETLPDAAGKSKTCTVSPMNKYCAWARHINDVKADEGNEYIEIKNFSVAYYMSWISPAPSYSGTCQNVKLNDTKGKFKFLEYSTFRRRLINLDDDVCEQLQKGSGWNWECAKKKLNDANDESPAISQLKLQTGSMVPNSNTRGNQDAE